MPKRGPADPVGGGAVKAGGRGGADHYTDVPVGDAAIKNVADLYLYPNIVRAVRVDGATVREWLERSAGCSTGSRRARRIRSC